MVVSDEEADVLSKYDEDLLKTGEEFWAALPWTVTSIFIPISLWGEITFIIIGDYFNKKYGETFLTSFIL